MNSFKKLIFTFINKDNWFYRLQQLIILVLHLILLKWMHYSLTETGTFKTSTVLFHFIGMSIYGAALIRGCAYWAKYHYEKEGGTMSHSQE